eukprot:SAG31_NODE_2232_length_6139_cov_6.945199_8_plen_108_part_00
MLLNLVSSLGIPTIPAARPDAEHRGVTAGVSSRSADVDARAYCGIRGPIRQLELQRPSAAALPPAARPIRPEALYRAAALAVDAALMDLCWLTSCSEHPGSSVPETF